MCIALAWSIALGNWLLKKHRRRKLRKQRKSRVASGVPGVYDQSTGGSRKKRGETINRPALVIPDPVPESINKSVSDSKDELISPISAAGIRTAREVPSWVPETAWGKLPPAPPPPRSPARPNFNNSSPVDDLDKDESYSLSEFHGQDRDAAHPYVGDGTHLSTVVLPPSPGRGQHDPNGDYFIVESPMDVGTLSILSNVAGWDGHSNFFRFCFFFIMLCRT